MKRDIKMFMAGMGAALMYEQIKEKHQIYVIAPLIEESDKIDLENVNKLEEKMTSAFGKICKKKNMTLKYITFIVYYPQRYKYECNY